jgi:hypothetical protein
VFPTRLSFEQPMTLRPQALGVIGIRLQHVLTPDAGRVHVVRQLEITPRGAIKLFLPVVLRSFRIENERMMARLKTFAEVEERGAR